MRGKRQGEGMAAFQGKVNSLFRQEGEGKAHQVLEITVSKPEAELLGWRKS